MKFKRTFLAFIATTAVLRADFNDDVFSANDTSTFDLRPGAEESQGPFTVRASFDAIGKAHFNKRHYRNQELQFSEYDVDTSWIFYYNPCRKEGLGLEIGYSHYNLNWGQNPYFDAEEFNMVSVGASFFTARAWRWEWKGFAKMNFNPDHDNLQNYMTWDLMVWGRFELATDWGMHTGILALTGMKIDRVYPIIGFDWTPNEYWKISAVFPTNVSIIYSPNCYWAFALQSRFWDVRQRVGKDENLSKAIWEYRNVGAELALTYRNLGWTLNVHAGYTTGGELKIYNHNKAHSHKMDFEAAPYAGAEVAYNF